MLWVLGEISHTGFDVALNYINGYLRIMSDDGDENGWGVVEQNVQKLMEAIGLPPGFVGSIYEERDWSFVIQLHALIEAAVVHALASKLGGELEELFVRMSMTGRPGRLEFATALGLLQQDSVKYIRILGRMRNACAHGIKNAVDFSVKEWLLKQNDRAQIVLDLCSGPEGEAATITMEGKATTRGNYLRENPKLVMHWLGGAVVAELYEGGQLGTLQRERTLLLEEHYALRKSVEIRESQAALQAMSKLVGAAVQAAQEPPVDGPVDKS